MFASTLVVGNHLCFFVFATAPLKVGCCCCCCPQGFVPHGKLSFCPQGFFPKEKLFFEFVPGVLSPRKSSSSFLGVSSPKGSWVGVDDATLASRCQTAVARRWAIRIIAADNAVRPMKADAVPGLYTLLPSRRRRADVSDLY